MPADARPGRRRPRLLLRRRLRARCSRERHAHRRRDELGPRLAHRDRGRCLDRRCDRGADRVRQAALADRVTGHVLRRQWHRDVLSDGQDVFGFPEAFTSIGGGTLFGIPNLVYIAVAFGIVFHVLLEKTVFGYQLRATGGNRGAAAANGKTISGKIRRVELRAREDALAAGQASTGQEWREEQFADLKQAGT